MVENLHFGPSVKSSYSVVQSPTASRSATPLLNTSFCWGNFVEYLIWKIFHNCTTSHPTTLMPPPPPHLPSLPSYFHSFSPVCHHIYTIQVSPYHARSPLSFDMHKSHNIFLSPWSNGHPHSFHVYRLISLQYNRTPLHWAASRGHTAACELLITRGGNVNALDDVSDCVMVNGGEKERGARGWGNGWIIVWVIIVLFLYFVFVSCIFLYFFVF